MSIVAATRYWYPSIARSILENPGVLDQAWYLSNLLDKHCFVVIVTWVRIRIRIRTPKRKPSIIILHQIPEGHPRTLYIIQAVYYTGTQTEANYTGHRPPPGHEWLQHERNLSYWSRIDRKVESEAFLWKPPQSCLKKHVVSENFMSRDHIMNCCLFHLREFAQVLFLPWSKILTDLVEKYWPRVSETIFVRHNQRSVVTEVFFAVGQLLDK